MWAEKELQGSLWPGQSFAGLNSSFYRISRANSKFERMRPCALKGIFLVFENLPPKLNSATFLKIELLRSEIFL